MTTKTCGECWYFDKVLFFCRLCKNLSRRFPAQDACDIFEPIPEITNKCDVITISAKHIPLRINKRIADMIVEELGAGNSDGWIISWERRNEEEDQER